MECVSLFVKLIKFLQQKVELANQKITIDVRLVKFCLLAFGNGLGKILSNILAEKKTE